MVAEADAGRVPADNLARALGVPTAAVDPNPVAGRVHLHWRVRMRDGRSGALRVPQMSHLGLSPRRNLIYAIQAFRRMGPSGSVPRLHAALRVSQEIPWGALLVDWVAGTAPSLPGDLPALGRSLAAIHALALPEPRRRRPLFDPAAPLDYLVTVIGEQLNAAEAGLAADIHRLLTEELRAARRIVAEIAGRPCPALIVSDSHPGNFRMTASGRAVLMDVERPLYDSPAVDLAHASLPTSLSWDPAVTGVAGRADIVALHRAWTSGVATALAADVRRHVLLYRRLVWLRTTTWACAWSARTGLLDRLGGNAAALPETAPPLAGRLARFVEPAMIERARAEWHGPAAFAPEELIP